MASRPASGFSDAADSAGPVGGLQAGMRLAIPCLISLALTSAAGAEGVRLPPTEPPQSAKTLPLKSGTGSAGANGCAAYGVGFTMVAGTCVKIGGTVRVDAVTGR
ncbi:hypothetical protein ACVWZ4_006192 [Bradyrhizobium sp. USDA 4472]